MAIGLGLGPKILEEKFLRAQSQRNLQIYPIVSKDDVKLREAILSEEMKNNSQSDVAVTARVFIIGKAQYNVMQARDFLLQKGIEAVGMFTVKEALQNFAKAKPTHAFFATSLTARKMDSIASMFKKSGDCICYVFPDDASLSANMTELKNSNIENKLKFNLSGPGIHRIIETWLKVENAQHISKAKIEARKILKQKLEAPLESPKQSLDKNKWYEPKTDAPEKPLEKTRLSKKEKRKKVAELKAAQDEDRRRALQEIVGRHASGETATPLWFEVDPTAPPQEPRPKRKHWSQRLLLETQSPEPIEKTKKVHWSEKLESVVPKERKGKKQKKKREAQIPTFGLTSQLTEDSTSKEEIDLSEMVRSVNAQSEPDGVVHFAQPEDERNGAVTVLDQDKEVAIGTVHNLNREVEAELVSKIEPTAVEQVVLLETEDPSPPVTSHIEPVAVVKTLYFDGEKTGVVTVKNQDFLGYAIFRFQGEAPNIDDLSSHIRDEFNHHRLREFGVAPKEGDALEVTHFEHSLAISKLSPLLETTVGEQIRFIEGSEQPISFQESAQSHMIAVEAARFLPEFPVSFDVFLRLELNQKYVNYICSGEAITETKKQKLIEKSVARLHIKQADKALFEEYCKITFILGRSKKSEKAAA
jgi:hypothetical protein